MSKRKLILKDKDRLSVELIKDKAYMNNKIRKMPDLHKRILNVIYRMRMIETKDIQKALDYKSYNALTVALREMYIDRFIDRRLAPLDVRMKKGNKQLFYMLDYAGAEFIKIATSVKDINWSQRDNLVQYSYALHPLTISKVYASLEEQARTNKVKIVGAVCDKHLYLTYQAGKKRTLRPDLKIVFDSNNKIYSFLMEIDRNTMNLTGSFNTDSFDKKVENYENYFVHADIDSEFRELPFVLTLTTNATRAEKLAEAVRKKQSQILKNNVKFLFSTYEQWYNGAFEKIFIDQYADFNREDVMPVFYSIKNIK